MYFSIAIANLSIFVNSISEKTDGVRCMEIHTDNYIHSHASFSIMDFACITQGLCVYLTPTSANC